MSAMLRDLALFTQEFLDGLDRHIVYNLHLTGLNKPYQPQ